MIHVEPWVCCDAGWLGPVLAALDERLLPGHLRALLGGSCSSKPCDISANQASRQATHDFQFATVTVFAQAAGAVQRADGVPHGRQRSTLQTQGMKSLRWYGRLPAWQQCCGCCNKQAHAALKTCTNQLASTSAALLPYISASA